MDAATYMTRYKYSKQQQQVGIMKMEETFW